MATSLSNLRVNGYESFDILQGVEPLIDYSQGNYDEIQLIYDGDVSTGMQLGSLLAHTIITMITSLEIGQLPGINFRDNKTGQIEPDLSRFANQFMRNEHSRLIKAVETKNRLGDVYVGLNFDSTLEVIPPQQVDPGFDLATDKLHNALRVLKKTLRNPKTGRKNEVTIKVAYTKEFVEFQAETNRGSTLSLRDFVDKPRVKIPHLLGRAPITLIPNKPEIGNAFGWSEFHHVVPMMQAYHLVLSTAIQAQQYHGKPVMKITGINSNILAWLRNSFNIEATQITPSVIAQVRTLMKQLGILILGQDQDAEFIQADDPLGGTNDLITQILGNIYRGTKIPEFLFGVSVNSANASIREQYGILTSYAENKRVELTQYLSDILGMAILAFANQSVDPITGLPNFPTQLGLSDPASLEQFSIEFNWSPILNSDSQLKLDVLKMLLETSSISRRNVLDQYKEYVGDVDTAMKELEAEHKLVLAGTLPASGGSKQPATEKNDAQRKRDDKGGKGDNSGGQGSGNA